MTRALAGDIAANAPLTVRAAKRTIDELVRNPQTPDLASLDAAVAACLDSKDYAEGRFAFKGSASRASRGDRIGPLRSQRICERARVV